MAEIHNPPLWYYHMDEDSEWWNFGGDTREQAIAKARDDYEDRPFWLSEAKRFVPSFEVFDADDLCERLSEDDEAWGEDGWTGEPLPPAMRILEDLLADTFKDWFAEHATLSGAMLDQIGTEFVPAQPTLTRNDEAARGERSGG